MNYKRLWSPGEWVKHPWIIFLQLDTKPLNLDVTQARSVLVRCLLKVCREQSAIHFWNIQHLQQSSNNYQTQFKTFQNHFFKISRQIQDLLKVFTSKKRKHFSSCCELLICFYRTSDWLYLNSKLFKVFISFSKIQDQPWIQGQPVKEPFYRFQNIS